MESYGGVREYQEDLVDSLGFLEVSKSPRGFKSGSREIKKGMR